MTRVIKPPAPLVWPAGEPAVFLAGSIEMGAAGPWQAEVERGLADLPATVLNPRRDEWDASWAQSIDNPPFRDQVEWELAGLERADVVAAYFDPATKAPVTLLELGLLARSGRLVVCCPPGYWRRSNVEVVCARYGVPLLHDLPALVAAVRGRLGRASEPLDYLPRMPARRDRGIGCVGAGFIMRDCHLVAYRAAGFNPVAIASRTPAAAREVADRHAVPKVYDTLDALLADPAVEVLDVAVPPQAQSAVIRRALAAGRHVRGILAQKPLALTAAEARSLADACDAAGVVLAVNQNMRYDQAVRALKNLLDRGTLGDVVLATIEMRAIPHWMPWSRELPSLATFVMSVHHLDTFRYWLGTPDRVLASTRPDPRTTFPHRDGVNLYVLEYDRGPRAAAWDDVWAGPAREGAEPDISIRWRVEGTRGMARGTVGWPGWPARVPSTLDYTVAGSPGWRSPRWPEAWFPDAFAGPMAELLAALDGGPPPNLSGRDNVETVALCQAVFAAATEHRVTTVREFLG